MLNEKEIKALLLCRIEAVSDSCNSYHINHVSGQIRALISVITGEIPPITEDTADIFDILKIPYETGDDGRLEVPDSWLLDHGFDAPKDKKIHHPRFSNGW